MSLLSKVDVILPSKRHYYIETNRSQYEHAHNPADLIVLEDILREMYPQYLLAFSKVMRKVSGHRFNMFVMKRDLFDSYCTWLFNVLFELENRIDYSKYNAYNSRVFGFIGERLLDVWIETNGIKYREQKVVFMVQNKEILIQRKQYTQKLKSWLGQNDLVKIVTGIRRCGKSKLFLLFQNELLQDKIATSQTIISINLEDVLQTREIGLEYNNNGFLTDYNKLLDYITGKLIPNKTNFVFIDEVQLLENWQLAANALKLIENVDLYLTGSNAYMFSGDLANSFGGRYVEIKMQPFSFREYCEASKEIELKTIYTKL